MFDEIIAFVTTSKWNKSICVAGLILTFSLFFMLLIKTPLSWYNDIRLSKNSPIATEQPIVTDSKPIDLISQIPNHHLFGSAIATDVKGLPITNLQLSLVGVIRAIPESKSSVIISSAGQQGKVYFVGDKLSETIKIGAIIEDGVILENYGRLEKLPLKRQKLAFHKLPNKLFQED